MVAPVLDFVEITLDDVNVDVTNWRAVRDKMASLSSSARQQRKQLRLVLTGDIRSPIQARQHIKDPSIMMFSDEVIVRNPGEKEIVIKRRY